jgi:hypothetical protein
MSAPRMSVDEWRKRLADTFKVNGLVGGHLRIVDEAEDRVSNYLVTRLRGQDALLCSFQSFFIETLILWAVPARRHSWQLQHAARPWLRHATAELGHAVQVPLDP